MRFVFSNIEFLFFSDLSEARYSVDELHSGCPPTIGLHSIFGDLPEGNMGILSFWAFYETGLPWTDKKLPLADSNSFKENLEWGLVLLARVEKKHWVAREL
jgi:hypothetical protein